MIHTVDHVEGRLRPELDALDAFLSHTWAVTVTGAPKTSAMMFLEEHEKSPRAWYGGAIGKIGFDGGLNTGLTLRTIRVKDGHAEVRVGATLLWDSDPVAEEEETELKASAFLDALRLPRRPSEVNTVEVQAENKRVLLVDHMDSFVHTLANYLRQTGAAVETQRAGFPLGELASNRPDLLVLSPGPGVPADFDTKATIEAALELDIPIFGVCLGLQAIVEYFGGELDQLETPMHGKSSLIETSNCKLFEGLPSQFKAGRYHSLYAMENMLPESIKIVAKSEDDNVVMAVEHAAADLRSSISPDSIMSFDDEVGQTCAKCCEDADGPNMTADILTHRDVIFANGPEAEQYLHGQISQNVDDMAEGDARWSFLLELAGTLRIFESCVLLRTRIALTLNTVLGKPLRSPSRALSCVQRWTLH